MHMWFRLWLVRHTDAQPSVNLTRTYHSSVTALLALKCYKRKTCCDILFGDFNGSFCSYFLSQSSMFFSWCNCQVKVKSSIQTKPSTNFSALGVQNLAALCRIFHCLTMISIEFTVLNWNGGVGMNFLAIQS